MRIVIELEAQPEAPPAGVIRWEGFGDGAQFSGWIEMLRLLELALRQGSEGAAKGGGLGPGIESSHDAMARRPTAEGAEH